MKPDNYNVIVAKLSQWSFLGEAKASNGALLIGHVPHVGPEAYLHKIYPGLTSSEIAGLEQAIARPIPAAYKQFLVRGNGISCFLKMSLDGLRRSYERSIDASRQPFHIQDANLHERPRDASENMVFIGGYTYDGSRLYMCIDDERVYHCPRRTVYPTLNVWSDLYSCLGSEIDRLATLFDRRGRLIDENVPTAPPANSVRADK